MPVTAMDTLLTTMSTSLTSNVNSILPVVGGLFVLIFGIKLVPKFVRYFVK